MHARSLKFIGLLLGEKAILGAGLTRAVSESARADSRSPSPPVLTVARRLQDVAKLMEFEDSNPWGRIIQKCRRYWTSVAEFLILPLALERENVEHL